MKPDGPANWRYPNARRFASSGTDIPGSRSDRVRWVLMVLTGLALLAVIVFVVWVTFIVHLVSGGTPVTSTTEHITVRPTPDGIDVERVVRPVEHWEGPVRIELGARGLIPETVTVEPWDNGPTVGPTVGPTAVTEYGRTEPVAVRSLTVNGSEPPAGGDGMTAPIDIPGSDPLTVRYEVPRVDGERQLLITDMVNGAHIVEATFDSADGSPPNHCRIMWRGYKFATRMTEQQTCPPLPAVIDSFRGHNDHRLMIGIDYAE